MKLSISNDSISVNFRDKFIDKNFLAVYTCCMLSVLLSDNISSETIPFFLSTVKAGFPSPALDYSQSPLDFNEYLVRNRPATYCLRVSGNSMIGAGIFDGDIIVVDRSITPVDGSIAVFAVDGEFTVKRFFRRNRQIILKAENPDYADIIIEPGMDFSLFGVVTSSVRKFV
jgi:DNA polymerase V